MTRKGSWIWGRGLLWGLPSDPVYWHPETPEKLASWLSHPLTWRWRCESLPSTTGWSGRTALSGQPLHAAEVYQPVVLATSSSLQLCWCQSGSPALPSSSLSSGQCPHFPPRAVLLDQSTPRRVRWKKLVQPPPRFLFQATFCLAASLVKVKEEKGP